MAVQRKGRGTRVGAKPVSLEQIEREAIRLFSEKTYPSVGMRDISDAVGLLPGSLYAHISNKEEILLRIVEQGIRHYIDALKPITESRRSAAERLRSAMHVYMSILDATLEQTRVSFTQWTYLGEENMQYIVGLRTDFEKLFSQIIDEGVASGEFPSLRRPRVVTLALIGMLNSAMHWYSPDGELRPSEIGDDPCRSAPSGEVWPVDPKISRPSARALPTRAAPGRAGAPIRAAEATSVQLVAPRGAC